jgi:hypothetical protein
VTCVQSLAQLRTTLACVQAFVLGLIATVLLRGRLGARAARFVPGDAVHYVSTAQARLRRFCASACMRNHTFCALTF